MLTIVPMELSASPAAKRSPAEYVVGSTIATTGPP
jgi:hypothetical protein